MRLVAGLSGAIVVVIAIFLIVEAWSGLRLTGRLVSDQSWHPTPEAVDGTFGILPMVVGTLVAAAGAVLLATPLGLASAIFSTFYAPPVLARWFRRVVELLAGIPSVVYGLWGLVVLVPLIRQWQPPGPSLLAAVIILTIMILPTMTLMAEAALRATPNSVLQAAAALGLSRWATVRAALPSARVGLLIGAMLQTGRAIGETMAVLMVAGNLVQFPTSLFDPVRTLTSNIALELGYALGDHRSALFATGLVLVALVFTLVTTAGWINRRVQHG